MSKTREFNYIKRTGINNSGDIVSGEILGLRLNTEPVLDSSLQLRTYELCLYAIVQVFSILVAIEINNILMRMSLSANIRIPWYIYIIGSLFAGHIGIKLATRSIENARKKIEQLENPIVNYFFNRFGKILIAFQAGGIAAVINLIMGLGYFLFAYLVVSQLSL